MPPSKKKINKTSIKTPPKIFVVFSFVLLILISLSLYQTIRHSQKFEPGASIPKFVPSSTPIPQPTAVLVDSNKTGWKTYQGSVYSISFPEDWKLKGGNSGSMTDHNISIISPTDTTVLNIGVEGDFQAGFGSTDPDYQNRFKEERITLSIGASSFTAKKITLGDITFINATTESYTYPLYGEFKPMTFWYGNGYPVTNSPKDGNQARLNFLQEESIVEEILRSFAFHPDKKNDNTPDRQTSCAKNGGTWRDFPNTCADTCGPHDSCGEAITDSCDCGKDKCWDGSSCINNM